MGYLELQGAHRKRIRVAIEKLFTAPSLRAAVLETYPAIEPEIHWNAARADVVSDLIDHANQHGVLDRLIVALAAERPHVEELAAIALVLAAYAGWTPPLERHGFDLRRGLEALTSPGGGFIDTTRLARWLIRTERQVCRVRCGAGAAASLGTGFLVAPDLVLTCYHVVEHHLAGEVAAAAVAVRFDYRRDERGRDPDDDPAAWIAIDPDWTIPRSPYSAKDLTLAGEPAADELDYALLRLARPAGRDVPAGEDAPRRWVDASTDRALPAGDTPILIVQHPCAPGAVPPAQQPLQITFDGRGFAGASPSGLRVAYRPSTLPGSSGSPVYDGQLAAVALHHNRGQIDPTAPAAGQHLDNRGIPLAKIRAHLAPEVRAQLIAPD